jgi:hypothetical protein
VPRRKGGGEGGGEGAGDGEGAGVATSCSAGHQRTLADGVGVSGAVLVAGEVLVDTVKGSGDEGREAEGSVLTEGLVGRVGGTTGYSGGCEAVGHTVNSSESSESAGTAGISSSAGAGMEAGGCSAGFGLLVGKLRFSNSALSAIIRR